MSHSSLTPDGSVKEEWEGIKWRHLSQEGIILVGNKNEELEEENGNRSEGERKELGASD